jgi:hypothetical protein
MSETRGQIGTDQPHQILLGIGRMLAWASTVATLPLVLGWIYLGLLSRDSTVPDVLPILTLSAVLYTAAVWTAYVTTLEQGPVRR